MLKTCSRCQVEKPDNEFYKKGCFRKYPTSSAGYQSHCKACVALDRKEAIVKHPKAKEQADRKQHLKRYNLTVESYNRLFAEQSGCCLGCARHQTEFNRNLSVDHDHKTGKVRGLLCVSCNLILGYSQDDPAVLKNLIEYLESHNSGFAETNEDDDNIIVMKRKSLGQ